MPHPRGKAFPLLYEEYLIRLIFNEKKSELDLEEVPDIVLSLLGQVLHWIMMTPVVTYDGFLRE